MFKVGPYNLKNSWGQGENCRVHRFSTAWWARHSCLAARGTTVSRPLVTIALRLQVMRAPPTASSQAKISRWVAGAGVFGSPGWRHIAGALAGAFEDSSPGHQRE